MTDLLLSDADQAMMAGEAGPHVALAMRIVTGLAAASGAKSLLDISRAHIDGCLYNGQASLDFAERLSGAQVAVPTTLNVSSLDLLHPDLIQSTPETQRRARALMDAYTSMGAQPTWTCAPYQALVRPAFGEQIAWAESSAVVFANSVLGARTDRYGDFIDAAAAITGRAPAAGLHLDENRRAEVVFDVTALSTDLKQRDAFFAMLGLIVGSESGKRVPAVVGIDEATEDQLKTLGAAAASSGSVGLVHVVGVTPEATHSWGRRSGRLADHQGRPARCSAPPASRSTPAQTAHGWDRSTWGHRTIRPANSTQFWRLWPDAPSNSTCT